jgi:hypothetical protein
MTIVKKIVASRIAKTNDIMLKISIRINHDSTFAVVLLLNELISIEKKKNLE